MILQVRSNLRHIAAFIILSIRLVVQRPPLRPSSVLSAPQRTHSLSRCRNPKKAGGWHVVIVESGENR